MSDDEDDEDDEDAYSLDSFLTKSLPAISLTTAPGSTTETCMPWCLSSCLRESDKVSTAHFVAWYGALSFWDVTPASEPMFTIRALAEEE